mmetsp:Transcript_33119/g.72153  ORF Transcript_33119/g.72153 Transcript_33119/m.72153 type:complete len:508 (+) Transcript_33119:249-1772(+)
MSQKTRLEVTRLPSSKMYSRLRQLKGKPWAAVGPLHRQSARQEDAIKASHCQAKNLVELPSDEVDAYYHAQHHEEQKEHEKGQIAGENVDPVFARGGFDVVNDAYLDDPWDGQPHENVEDVRTNRGRNSHVALSLPGDRHRRDSIGDGRAGRQQSESHDGARYADYLTDDFHPHNEEEGKAGDPEQRNDEAGQEPPLRWRGYAIIERDVDWQRHEVDYLVITALGHCEEALVLLLLFCCLLIGLGLRSSRVARSAEAAGLAGGLGHTNVVLNGAGAAVSAGSSATVLGPNGGNDVWVGHLCVPDQGVHALLVPLGLMDADEVHGVHLPVILVGSMSLRSPGLDRDHHVILRSGGDHRRGWQIIVLIWHGCHLLALDGQSFHWRSNGNGLWRTASICLHHHHPLRPAELGIGESLQFGIVVHDDAVEDVRQKKDYGLIQDYFPITGAYHQQCEAKRVEDAVAEQRPPGERDRLRGCEATEADHEEHIEDRGTNYRGEAYVVLGERRTN